MIVKVTEKLGNNMPSPLHFPFLFTFKNYDACFNNFLFGILPQQHKIGITVDLNHSYFCHAMKFSRFVVAYFLFWSRLARLTKIKYNKTKSVEIEHAWDSIKFSRIKFYCALKVSRDLLMSQLVAIKNSAGHRCRGFCMHGNACVKDVIIWRHFLSCNHIRLLHERNVVFGVVILLYSLIMSVDRNYAMPR